MSIGSGGKIPVEFARALPRLPRRFDSANSPVPLLALRFGSKFQIADAIRSEMPPYPLPEEEVEGKKKALGEDCPDAVVEAVLTP